MSKFDEFFKFKIGETVQTLTTNEKYEKVILFIVGRHIEECPGGHQFYYGCRVHHDNGGISTSHLRFNEVELKAFDYDEEAKETNERQFENYKRIEELKMKAREAAKEGREKK